MKRSLQVVFARGTSAVRTAVVLISSTLVIPSALGQNGYMAVGAQENRVMESYGSLPLRKTGIRRQHSTSGEALRRMRRLLSGVSFVVVVGLIEIMGLAFPETAFSGENDPSSTITVQIYNYSQASPAILTGAEGEAARILGEAGLRAVWLECAVGPSTPGPQGSCQKAPESTDIRLRILSAPIQNRFQDTVFGFTVHPVLASVYYDLAVRRAESDDAEFKIPIILGCVIAHELGHLLLGPNGPSRTGIMQPQWERKQIHQIMMGTLVFTTEQARLIRAQVLMRTKVQTAVNRGIGH